MATVASSQEQFDGFPLKTESTRLKILFSPEGHNAPPLQKTFLVKDGQEAMLETLLRRAFGVPPHLTVSLVLDGDIICCPVHLIDLNEARRAKEIELQTFPSTQPIAPTFAPQPPVSTVPHVEFPDTYVPPVALQPSAPMATARPKSKPTSRSSSTNNVADLAASTPPVAADVTSSSTSAPAKKTAAPKRARKAPIEAPSSGSHLIAGDADVDSDPDAGGALDASREDRRKNNRGLDHRRSYLKEEKILVMWLKDCGRSADEIAQLTRVSKSNVEKWCSDKTRDKILAKYRNTSAGSGAGDVLTTSLDANGLHFLATDKFAMQSALLFLLDRLRTLSSESHMVVDEDALFAAADLTRHSQTSYGATAALSGGHGFYVAHMPVPAAQINYLPPLARELTDKVHASVVQQAFAHANKRARIGEVVQSQSQQLLQQAASLLGAFNRPSEGATAAVEDEEEEEDDDDDEESAREMLEQMLHQRRASLGLAGTAPSAAKKWSALDVLSAAAGPVDVDALPKTFGSSSIVSAKAPPATSYTASSSAPSTASMTSSAASATTLPLSSLPPLLPRYENVRMEYTDQFALSVASRPANEFGADAVPPEVGSNGATPRETTSADATIAPLSTAGVVQAQRQLLPSTKFLLHLRPQLLQQQDEEDAAVLTLLGE